VLYRARTYSEVLAEDGPAPAPVAALAAAAPPRQQQRAASSVPAASSAASASSLEALLAVEYERGRSDTIALAKEKISDMKENASARFAAMQAQLDEAQRRNEKDRDTAREAVQRLREELRAAAAAREAAESALETAQAEKDALADKSQKYVAQLRARMAEASESAASDRRAAVAAASVDVVRASLERVFTNLHAQVKPKELYEGTEVLALVRAVLKQASTEAAQQ
jgi:chromosome segregation ATPase